jgi:hypothetical protein
MAELRNLSRLIGMRGNKADIETFDGTLEEQAFAYAEDTGQIGVYTNGAWAWGGASGGAGGHLHGIARWAADGSETDFELPDLAEYIESVTVNGAEADVTGYTLSADGSQLVFSAAPTATNIILAHYVIRSIS